MKKIITLLVVSLFSTTMWAQAPQKMSYQAVIRNAGNVLVANVNVRMRISVLQGTATGTAVYVETQATTTNINGLVTVEIGTGTVVSGTFASIAWGTNAYFIKTETDPTGGTNYTIVGTSQFLSVPYALFAASGTPGPQGPQGLPGATGPQGPIGLTGSTGPQGAPGTNGTNGTNGAVGATGPQGAVGLTGPAGPQGAPGTNGTNGTNGAVGATGPQGPIGLTGAIGLQGIQGIPGAANISGTTSKIVKFGTATTGVDSQISDEGTIVKVQPIGYTGYTLNDSRMEIAGSNNTLRLIGTGATYGQFGKLMFGDGDRVYVAEDIDDNMLINPYGRLAIMGGNVGVGTLNPAEKLDVNGKIKTTNLQVTTGAGAGKVLTSDISGNATWQAGGAVNQEYETSAYNLSTAIQGADVDFPTTNVTAPVAGTYLITYFLDAYNTFNNTCFNGCGDPLVFFTNALLYNKTTNGRYQTQRVDFSSQDQNNVAATSVTITTMPAHQISGSVVRYLDAGDQIGFKMRSLSDPGTNGEIRIRESVVTLVRLR